MNLADARHGSIAGYICHRRGGETACDPCRVACALYERERKARKYLARGPLRVPATGTRRRIQALAAIGWGLSDLDAQLGRKKSYTHTLINQGETVLRTTADDIATLYDRLSMTAPVGWQADRLRRMAARRGWAPPLAWDERTINDPEARPHGAGHIDPDRATALTDLDALGLGITEVCTRLGVRRDNLERWCERHGMRAVFERVAARERPFLWANQHGAAS